MICMIRILLKKILFSYIKYMKKAILVLFVVVLACSCVTETGLTLDMRVSERPVEYISKDGNGHDNI